MTAASTEPAPTLEPVEPRRRAANPKGRFLFVCALLAAAVVLVLYKGLLSSLNYFDTVDQALNHRAQIGTTSIRLEGVVVPGTVRTTTSGASFAISGADGRTVRVLNVGSPPELFQPDIPVVVVGSFATATSDLFDSNQILVKHSASYVAQHPGRVRAPNGSTR
ncbi:MAG TPA: cytochrome c maturation protein CcmE [Acidimicrobiales bacterium]|jgi:cytochrome c-type biogenesis protein CcmE|nr:cytochrome c maturation protein CcmE [Acidimicrobiales bacterium]